VYYQYLLLFVCLFVDNYCRHALEVDQSTITGESLPIHCGANDRVYSGSVVLSGAMNARVVETGVRSMLGNTVNLVRQCNV
jgi:cation transport ATPase